MKKTKQPASPAAQKTVMLCVNERCSNHGNCDLWSDCDLFIGAMPKPKAKTEAKQSKYGAEKVTMDGITFDSRKEARRWYELQILQRKGEITNLERQKSYELIPTQREYEIKPDGTVKQGKVIERAVHYVADFVYQTADGKTVVEDVKGYRDTASAGYAKFVIKRKLMLFKYGIRVKEV